MEEKIKQMNKSFKFFQIESSSLIPNELINSEYTEDKYFKIDKEFSLKPETTPASYDYAKEVFTGEALPPICVYQLSKSFRREDDKTHRHMRLKEFYQLEFQIIYSPNTATDYSINIYPDVLKAVSDMIGECKIEESVRLPDYSEQTTDIICVKSDMEVCSISKRKDLEGYKVIEIAIGTDRCIYNFQNK